MLEAADITTSLIQLHGVHHGRIDHFYTEAPKIGCFILEIRAFTSYTILLTAHTLSIES